MAVVKMNYTEIINFIQSQFPGKGFVPLHEPKFLGNEKKYVSDAIDSTFVSSVGAYVNRFEEMMAELVGVKYAVATVNGTAALHLAMITSGVRANDLVITQALTFVATCNAISYLGATPVFVDVDNVTMGMSPKALESWLHSNSYQKFDVGTNRMASFHKKTSQKITAAIPMHTFGHPCQIDEIAKVCGQYHISLIEDAAEAIGSYYDNKHVGSFGVLGAFSFNGNKTLTSGGGGVVVTDDERLARLAKYLSTQAKQPHPWEFNHDLVGYNYRMPNINAALACAQLEQLNFFLQQKRALAADYEAFFERISFVKFKREPKKCVSNYWLNTIELSDQHERDEFLKASNDKGVMTRPAWTLMNKLPMFRHGETDGLVNSTYLADRIVNIPSSVRVG